MRSLVIVSCAIIASLVLTFSLTRPVKPVAADVVQIQDDGQRRPGRGGGGGFGGAGGPGAGGMIVQRDELSETVATLGDLNLTPQFTLTKEQKEKITAVRDRVKEAQAKWRKEKQADLDKLQEEMRAAREAGGGGGQELRQKVQEIMATAPKVDEANKEILAVLTDEQRKAFDQKLAQRREEETKAREEMRRQLGGRGGGGGGRGGAGGNRQPNQQN